jgi:hypothetical protein
MFRKKSWWAVVLSVALVPFGGTAQAQMGAGSGSDYAPPEYTLPLPLYNTRPEDGGFFAALSFEMYRQTNPLKEQIVAIRGFLDVDGSIANASGLGLTPHTFFGSGTTALDVNQVTGPNHYTPGFKVDLGWKFGDNTALTFGWLYLFQIRTTAVASVVPPSLNVRADFADSFMFSPVINLPPQYSGPVAGGGKTGVGNPTATFGIWNGASLETIDFTQKFQQWDLTWRETVMQDECYRLNGLMGPRFAWIWEEFRWRTFDTDTTGAFDPSFEGIYTNIISNRMYGAFVGMQGEYYLGHGFACMLEAELSAYLDIIKKRAKYELGAKLPPVNHRNLTDYSFVPEGSAKAELMWYPYEGIQLKIGYNLMAFLNTASMKQAISFDYSALTPMYTQSNIRYFDGIEATIAISF